MQIICQGNQTLCNLLGFQSIDKTAEYKCSMYTFCYEEKKYCLLFNTLTRKIVSLSNEEYNEYKKYIEKKRNDISSLIEKLISNWFIINKQIDEISLYSEIYEIFKPERQKNFSGFETYVIFTTTACNARCFYCFERNVKPIHMSIETAKVVSKYIRESHRKKHTVCLHWFGGEPLCNIKVIDEICATLKEYEIEYTSRFTSNASIFTKDIIDRAISNWHMDKIQITLDGTENVHNLRKNYIDTEKYNFIQTINNIDYLIKKKIYVTIRLNCDENNIEDMEQLISYLTEHFEGQTRIFIDPHPLFNCDNNELILDSTKSFYQKMLLLEEKATKYNQQYNEEVKKDKSHAIERFRMGSCQSLSMRIGADGSLYPCQHIDQIKPYGNVWDGITNQELFKEWRKEKHHPLCITCQFRPLCGSLEHCNAIRSNCKEYAILKYGDWIKDIYNNYNNSKKFLKLNQKFTLYPLLNQYIAFPNDSNPGDKKVVKLNTSALFMWNLLEKGIVKANLIQKIQEEYQISFLLSEQIVNDFVLHLSKFDFLECT